MTERPPAKQAPPRGRRETAKQAGPLVRKRRAGGLHSVAREVDLVLKPLSAKKGFAEFDLARAWPSVMGAELAGQCTPQRLVRGPEGRDGTLHLGVWGPLALELQHLTPQLVERINGHYGYRAVAKIVFHQTPPSRLIGAAKRPEADPTEPRDPARDAHDAAHDAALEAQAATISDPEMRAALISLGRSIREAARSGE